MHALQVKLFLFTRYWKIAALLFLLVLLASILFECNNGWSTGIGDGPS